MRGVDLREVMALLQDIFDFEKDCACDYVGCCSNEDIRIALDKLRIMLGFEPKEKSYEDDDL